jgi:3-hydroxyisobutyrate dehydrogenase-like beta-hydroxyacid dehydrogenase
MKVGFIGLGHMGSGMAARLLDAGFDLVVYNRTAEKARPLVERGARLARSVAEACAGDVVVTMLADDDAVESAAFGDGGIVASLRSGAKHVSMSTISVALSERLAKAHASKGQEFVAAPVFGRPDAAAAGKLFIIPAGAEGTIEACRPLFEAMGQKVLPVSARPPDANLVKLAGNFMIASIFESLGEAMALVGKAGIERQRFYEILTSTLFTAPVYVNYGKLIVDEKFEPPGFAAPLGLKDMRLALAAAEDLRVPMPLASLLRDRFVRLLAQRGDAIDWSAVAALAFEDANLHRSRTAPISHP